MALGFGFQFLILTLSLTLSYVPLYHLFRRKTTSIVALAFVLSLGIAVSPLHAFLFESYVMEGSNYVPPNAFPTNLIIVIAIALFFAPYIVLIRLRAGGETVPQLDVVFADAEINFALSLLAIVIYWGVITCFWLFSEFEPIDFFINKVGAALYWLAACRTDFCRRVLLSCTYDLLLILPILTATAINIIRVERGNDIAMGLGLLRTKGTNAGRVNNAVKGEPLVVKYVHLPSGVEERENQEVGATERVNVSRDGMGVVKNASSKRTATPRRRKG